MAPNHRGVVVMWTRATHSTTTHPDAPHQAWAPPLMRRIGWAVVLCVALVHVTTTPLAFSTLSPCSWGGSWAPP